MKSLVLLCAALFCASCAEEPKRLVGAHEGPALRF